MTSPITLTTAQNLQVQFLTSQQKDVEKTHSYTNEVENKPSNTSTTEDFRYSRRVSNINPEKVKALYGEIKAESNKELEAFNLEDKTLKPFDYLSSNIEKIMDYPIDVKIERDEINIAILYNSLGISFLDVKRIEVKMELLELAKEEVGQAAKAGAIRKDEANTLQKMIEGNMNSLFEEKQSLLERKHIKENEDLLLEQLKRSSVS